MVDKNHKTISIGTKYHDILKKFQMIIRGAYQGNLNLLSTIMLIARREEL